MKSLTRIALLAFLGLVNFAQISFSSVVSTGNFKNDFYVTWAPTHMDTSADGTFRSLKLDNRSGASFASNLMFLFGRIDMQIKLVPGHSAGTVVAFFMTSEQPNRDEINLEFLGNVSGQPYILQTNIYADGLDKREERIYLWFDPTRDFHTYSIFWNLYQIIVMVDSIPIRTYRNHADKGIAYPRWQPMSVKASIWNGDSWATRGGQDKIDWSKGPFIASFKNYKIDACIWHGNARFCRGDSTINWWNKERFRSLTSTQRSLFEWVRKHYLVYDYCQDKERFRNGMPPECFLPKY